MDSIRPPLWPHLEAADLMAALRHPPDRYRPVPWLAWTGELDWEILRGQLADMREKGITEFFLFPIYGMELPYMSAEYWRRVRQTLQFCRDNGMKCWIYDEYNWPSGVCAGTVMRDYQKAREKLLWMRLKQGDELPTPPVPMELHESGGVTWGIAESTEARINVMGCDWLTPMPGYLNVADPVACRAFIETTHEEYLRQCGEFFPDTIPGFFTDEPGPHIRAGGGWFGFVCSDDLFADFQQRFGYDLRERLSDLLVASPTAAQTRCHFQRWLSERWGKAYAGQQREWCDRHRVALTGHCLGEDSLVTQLRMAGDLWEPLQHFTIPGIDMLANADAFGYPYRTAFYGDIDRRAFNLTCKFVHGVCRQTGAREMLSEAYGVCDWGTNLFAQKRGFNYQVALGVTLFNDNSLVTSIADFRKYAIAGKHFTQPWWRHYKQYADYNARLAAIHAEGEQVADIAMLFPRSTMWALADADIYAGPWNGHFEGHPFGALQELIFGLLDELVRGLWQADFIFEPVLARAHVEGAELVTPYTRYRTLIVPSATDLPAECLETIRAFAEAGGEVIFAGELPARVVDSQEDPGETVAETLRSAHVQHVAASGPAVCQALRRSKRPALELAGEGSREFVCSHRRLAGSDLLFVANMAEREVDVRVRVTVPGLPVVLDPDTLEVCRPEGREFGWHFEPLQAFVLITGQAAQPGVLAPEPLAAEPWWLHPERTVTLDGPWDFSVEPDNMLRLTYQVRPDPDNRGAVLGWQRDEGEEGWLTPEGRRLPEAIKPGDSPWYWLRAKVTCEAGAKPRTLVADNPDFLETFVNGRPARQIEGQPLWTEENVHFDVSGLLHEGDNWVCVRARTSKYNDPRIAPMPGITNHLLQPVVLMGEFRVTREGHLAPWIGKLDVSRAWDDQGLPHFAGIGTYKRVLTWSGRGRVGLRLPACTDAVEVFANGESGGIRAWPPYVWDLTPLLRGGQNSLELRVANTLGNIILETYGGERPSQYPTSGLKAAPVMLVF